ncbi:hypothetical protein FGF66_10965 [Chlorobaculum thiosulfatiphilum]|jgi:hypothetical protein|uniref:Uncharacterized protein n=1 Tax=Chlorobaculum thiosulfatiphilum TaxID=115852 RepID=A0A5C4S330_CHLTI|nr:DUF6804 family protein [Chlorobaculum thiosulfatiphilum]TNJ37171.1 hypothetical protein FGF66_10965 [Chlorobaculum thiosulfatiphilum]
MPVQIVYATAAMLLIALFPVPESYREILNVIAFGTFGWGAYRNFEPIGPMTALAVVYVIFALLFNPITPVVLPELPSILLHIGGAALLAVTARRFER